MRDAQESFPIDVRTGWADYSPALRHHASQRIRSRLAGVASEIRSVTVRISNDDPRNTAQRRCDIELIPTHAGPISGSSVGVELFTLVDRAVDAVMDMLRQRRGTVPRGERRQRIA